MRKSVKKIGRAAIGGWLVLSLLAASVAACACSHHAEAPASAGAVPACHEHAKPKNESAAPAGSLKSESDECSCLQPAPRIVSKSETLKVEKQAAAFVLPRFAGRSPSVPESFENSFAEKPFYLFDSFYNIRSPRAPPAA